MSKKRVSLTLEEELVDRVDTEADVNNVNRSQQVEEILQSYFRNKDIETAVIFCGGEETHSMNNYDGKPVLGHIIDNLSEDGIKRIILLSGKNREEIESHFGSAYRGVNLEYVSEEEPEGTAIALSKIEDRISNTFLVLNGHVLSDVDIDDMLEVHRDEDSTATIALTTVTDTEEYGVARLKGRTILGFEEKPSPGEEPSRLINAGTYIFEPEIFSQLDEDSIEEVFENLSSQRKLSGYIYGGEWKDFARM